jgi:uncharacterized coiled-coil DUF342 family protein
MIVWKSEFNKAMEEIKLVTNTQIINLKSTVTNLRSELDQVTKNAESIYSKVITLSNEAHSDIVEVKNEIAILQHQFNQLKDIMGSILKSYPALGEIIVESKDSVIGVVDAVEKRVDESITPTQV